MKIEDYNSFYNIKGDIEKKLWKDCVFVFDTSALLEFYYYSPKARASFISDVFTKIKGKLWITSHTEFEYLKNRESVLKKPFNEKYKKIQEDLLSALKKDIEAIDNKLIEFDNRTKGADTHPFIDEEITKKLLLKYQDFKKDYVDFETNVNKEFKKREDEINELEKKDVVYEDLNGLFKVGSNYDYKKIEDIIQEGEKRLISRIPPGYKDASGKGEKEGIQKFGDLIIWKQIIDIANMLKKPIIFITNDVKEDWCASEKRANENRIVKPKEDLITEFKDKTNRQFWMYTFAQFLYKSKEYLESNITAEAIKEVEEVTTSNTEFNKYYEFSKIYDEAYSRPENFKLSITYDNWFRNLLPPDKSLEIEELLSKLPPTEKRAKQDEFVANLMNRYWSETKWREGILFRANLHNQLKKNND